ncbi:MAG: hypothetical protein NVS2B5_21040 [Beijerinckiaceae bacterium]
MKKLTIGVIAASFTALLALSGTAYAQAGPGQTGMGDAKMKDAPTSAAVGAKPGGMKMMRHHRKHRRHH